MNPEAQVNLEEEVTTLRGLLGHKGWIEMVTPTVLMWQAAVMKKWLTDVGDTRESNDFLRGQVVAYKQVLKHFHDRLAELQVRLDEARTGKPQEHETGDMPAI